MKSVFIEMEKMKNLNSGLGQFCFHLGHALASSFGNDIEPLFYMHSKLKGIFGPQYKYKEIAWWHKFVPVNSSKNQVWHCTHQQSNYLPSSSKTRLILTIHDLNFLEKNYSLSRKKMKLNALQNKVDRADVITVISEYSAQVTRQYLNVKDKTIKVIYNGNSLKIFENSVRPAFVKSSDFIFTIGVIDQRKNFKTLLSLLSSKNDLHLIIAGNNADDYAKEMRAEAVRFGVSEKLMMPGLINDSDKYWLYKNCTAFVFPSLAEGFGLPVVEAMSLGKPVFLSDATSLPEIGGKEAYYWNNFEPEYMLEVFQNGMKEYVNDMDKPNRIKQWAAQFSWAKAATDYINIYKDL